MDEETTTPREDFRGRFCKEDKYDSQYLRKGFEMIKDDESPVWEWIEKYAEEQARLAKIEGSLDIISDLADFRDRFYQDQFPQELDRYIRSKLKEFNKEL